VIEFGAEVMVMEETRQEIKALEKRLFDFAASTDRKIHELVVANERLSHEVRRLTDALRHQREHEETERRILRLEMENYLLRQERGLSPTKPLLSLESETDEKKDRGKANEK
jgi:hypothetical protein